MKFPYLDIEIKDDNERWMLEALKEAWKAYQADEVPIGAVLVKEGKVIARGHNQVETLRDATAHAEMLCLTAGSVACDNWRLLNTTLYCTVEPCSMCAGALILSRVDKLVWGTQDTRQGANGSWIDLFEKRHEIHNVTISTGVLALQASELMKRFFKNKREKRDANRSLSQQ